MAIHSDVTSLTCEVIDEYLSVAERCISSRKEDGGIHGYAATLLLFCVVNAIGSDSRTGREPFRVLNDAAFDCKLDDWQIKKLEEWYRNLLTHNAMITHGTCLTPEEEGSPFGFSENNEPIQIRVKPFYRLVRAAWDRLDKTRINSTHKPELYKVVTKPIDLSTGTYSAPVTASGSQYIPAAVSHKQWPGNRS